MDQEDKTQPGGFMNQTTTIKLKVWRDHPHYNFVRRHKPHHRDIWCLKCGTITHHSHPTDPVW